MSISWYFRNCKALLLLSLTHVSSAIASVQESQPRPTHLKGFSPRPSNYDQPHSQYQTLQCGHAAFLIKKPALLDQQWVIRRLISLDSQQRLAERISVNIAEKQHSLGDTFDVRATLDNVFGSKRCEERLTDLLAWWLGDWRDTLRYDPSRQSWMCIHWTYIKVTYLLTYLHVYGVKTAAPVFCLGHWCVL